MKKIIAFAALAILVSSCGNKMTLMKRHYTKGYYLHHTNDVGQHEQAFADRAKTDKMPTTKTYVSEPKKDIAVVASVVTPVESSTSSRASRSDLSKKVNKAQTVTAKTKDLYLKKKIQAFKELESRRSGGGDANLLLLVILSLFPFICLIAMYLHDGKKITLNFWICLLLHLTLILWLVFALLVDFDVINLA